MTPVQNVLDRLKKPHKTSSGWVALCPAHDDRTPSLSVNEGADGTALLKCHAGCKLEEIVSSLGLEKKELFPPRAPSGRPAPTPKRKPTPAFATANAAVADLERKLGKRSADWKYTDAAGVPVGLVLRWDRSDGKKDIRPVAKHADGWRVGAMPPPRPLYRLPDLAAAGLVVVTEGEKAADAARGLGFTATTSSGGCKAEAKTDWSPLAGKDVLILPDNDDPGRGYAADVARILTRLDPPARVKILELHELRVAGDVFDWIKEFKDKYGEEMEPALLKEETEKRAAEVSHWNPPASEALLTPKRQKEIEPGRLRPHLVVMSEVKPQKVRWLWPGRLALGKVHILNGRPGAGKSFLTCGLCGLITTEGEWPDGGRATLGDVLLIAAEDDPADTIAPRLLAAGADLKRVTLMKGAVQVEKSGEEKEVAFTLQNIELISDALDKLTDCRLIVVDPIGSYLGGSVDSHRDNEVRAVLAPLGDLARERGVCVLLVSHTRKASVTFADDSILGSRAFSGLARGTLHLSEDPENKGRKLLLASKLTNGAPTPGLAFRITGDPARIEWEPDPIEGMNADDAVAPRSREPGESRRGRPASKLGPCMEWLSGRLAQGPVRVQVLREEAENLDKDHGGPFKADVLYRARTELGVEEFEDGGRKWWKLPSPPAQEDANESTTE